MKKNPKSKSKAIILAADGAGGMMQVEDRRFEGGEWPIRFEVPLAQSDTWLKYLSTECSRRGWSRSSMGQMNPNENSGSLTISTGGPSEPQLAIAWERKRGGPIKIRAR